MPLLEVKPAQLKAKANELITLNNSFKSEIISLENIEASLKNKWSGEANEKFHNNFLNDKSKMDEFTSLIERYIESMIAIAEMYDKTENYNHDLLSTRRY